MKKNYQGFFLSETIVVITICAVVLLGVFNIYSSSYAKYKENEKYNTPNVISALSAISNYYSSIESVDINDILDTAVYTNITNYASYQSDYFDKLKEVYNIDNVYLINLSSLTDAIMTDSFDLLTRKYLATIKKLGGVVMVVECNTNEFTYKTLTSYNDIKLLGDETDEYAVYLNIGDEFTDPLYTGYVGEVIKSCDEDVVGCSVVNNEVTIDTTKEGIYYIYYNFDGLILRRKVVVSD